MKYESIMKEIEKNGYTEKGFEIEGISATTQKEIIDLLIYRELVKSLANKTTAVVLDALYDHSRTVDKEVSTGYYRIISTDKTGDSKVQLKHDGKDNMHFNASTKYKSLFDEIEWAEGVKYTPKMVKGTCKNIRVSCKFDQVVDVYKVIAAVLATAPTATVEVEGDVEVETSEE